jgi:hypothetical protein
VTGAARAAALVSAAVAALLAGCGGGIDNPEGAAGQKLSFAYFQRCIEPILQTPLQINQNGVISTNTCAGGGCHDSTTGTGGALRVVPNPAAINVLDGSNTPDVIHASDMYKNFYSAQASVTVGAPTQSRLITKPLVLNVLHGGGLIFANRQDPNVKLIEYWITHPAPTGQDEFSTTTYNMFTPPDPMTGTCNTQ